MPSRSDTENDLDELIFEFWLRTANGHNKYLSFLHATHVSSALFERVSVSDELES